MIRETLAGIPQLPHGRASHDRYVFDLQVEPFKIIGNTYYVGDKFCPSYLIDAGEGLVLLDTPFSPSAYLLIESIWELGFDPRNVKYIIHSHGHADHYGCTIPLIHLSGCKTVMGEHDAKQLKIWAENGHPHHWGYAYDSFIPDIWLKDGDTFEFGTLSMRAVHVPGHSLGAMAYFWEEQEAGQTYTCGTFGGTGFNTLSHQYCHDNNVSETIRDEFIRSLDKVRDEKVDVHIGNHAFQSFMFEKNEMVKSGACSANPFIDPQEWPWFIDKTKEAYLAFKEDDDKKWLQEKE